MLSFIRKIISTKLEAKMKTKLSNEKAVEIAKTADIDNAAREQLSIATAIEENGKIVWSVSSLVKGAKDIVYVDDETGTIIRTKHVGIR